LQLPKKCFVDRIPDNGFYFFREVGKGTWVITSDIKVNRTISEKERQLVMRLKGYDEKEAYKKYKEAFEKRMKIVA
jgi:DnaJ-class molecular chaperone